MHGDIREDVARFYTELTHRLLGGTINHDHINVPCDLRLTKMDVWVEVKAAGTPEHPFVFMNQLEKHLEATGAFPNPETCWYGLWRYHNGIAKREKQGEEPDLISNTRRLTKRATSDKKLKSFLASETLTLFIVDARILRLMSLQEGGTVQRLHWNEKEDIVAGGITRLRKIAKDVKGRLAAMNEEVRDFADNCVLNPRSFASIKMECALTFKGHQMAFPTTIIVEKEMLELLKTESRSLKRFFPKER